MVGPGSLSVKPVSSTEMDTSRPSPRGPLPKAYTPKSRLQKRWLLPRPALQEETLKEQSWEEGHRAAEPLTQALRPEAAPPLASQLGPDGFHSVSAVVASIRETGSNPSCHWRGAKLFSKSQESKF